MAVSSSSLILPGKGTVFVAPVGTTPPTDLSTIDPNDTTTYTGFDCLGHTSRSNAVALTKDGGDATSVGSWLSDSVRTSYAPINYGCTVNGLQMDELTLGLAFGGGVIENGGYTVKGSVTAVDRAVLILFIDGAVNSGILAYNASVTIGDAPSVSVDDFLEVQLSAAWNVDSNGNLFHFYTPTALVASP